MHDIITKKEFDVSKEYERIWKMFNTSEHIGKTTPLSVLVDGCFYFFPNSFKKRSLDLTDFNDTYGFSFKEPCELITVDELILYCEYIITLCDHLTEYAFDALESDSDFLLEDIHQTIDDCMDELGLVAAKKDNITIYVHKEPAVIAVADVVDESLAYYVKSYIHKQTAGNLTKKKTILKYLADDIEPQRNKLNGINKTFADSLFQMLQKFVRHNNDKNPYISGLSSEELEKCYDDIYQMWLLAKLEIDNLERKNRVKTILQQINSK